MSVTIYDVAKKAGVAISTVSRVLNNTGYVSEKTRKRVMGVVEELNYEKNMLAVALMKKQTKTIGLIIPDITNHFYADLTRAVEDEGNRHGFNVILCNTDNDMEKEASYVSFLLQKNIDGIIFASPKKDDPNIKALCDKNPQFPIVQLGGEVEGVNTDKVLVENSQGAYDLTKHLIELGHESFGVVLGHRNSLASKDRLDGINIAINEANLRLVKQNILYGDFKMQDGLKSALQLLKSKNRPTAIIAATDLLAIGCYQAAKSIGLSIPDDLSITGFDDIEIAQAVEPALTTVTSPIEQLGVRAVEMVVSTIEKPKAYKEKTVYQPTMVIRGSTGTPVNNYTVSS
ncbi:LacI family DNA-binding transcriptional regulator [Aquibacillus albus]|uniref:LacI family transcriptional regulator n=1 Tax=Aquibacillus albus TaxID=1168171 RepID=A0ABS2MXV4_9BACI|nr:LacI family DNA-binding transcriptional regulator [Aquibacillus albus]MBM7570726.1 LacI family transcriptional regulator [Aquibacillus albus]